MNPIQKIITETKEENDRCTIGNNEESELAEFNLFQLEKLQALLKGRDESIYLVGLLGYPLDLENIINASKLLIENEFDDVVNCINDINLYNAENNTCAFISLAGMFPSMKIKDAEGTAIDEILTNNISI
jgi:hypothetical protein